MSKACATCKQSKSLDLFSRDYRNKTGITNVCKDCRNQSTRLWRLKNPEKIKNYDWTKRNPDKNKEKSLRYKFGISLETYRYILKAQNNSCAICGLDVSQFIRDLAVDHCHKTLKIRGLLCIHCNTGLGKFNDSKELLTKAINYLSSAGKTKDILVLTDKRM